jgi:hypothetical protein
MKQQHTSTATSILTTKSTYRSLTLYRPATYKNVISISCIVDGSCLSAFSSYMCICQLVWLIYCFKLIKSLMQDVWVSSYKQTDWSWLPILRTIRLQQRYHSFRYSLCFPSVAVMALRRNVLQEGDILCELYADTRSDVSWWCVRQYLVISATWRYTQVRGRSWGHSVITFRQKLRPNSSHLSRQLL